MEGRKLGFIFENPSPPVRGKLLYQFLRRARLGLIPARAGENEEGELGVLPVVQAVLPVLPDQFFVVPPYKAVD